MRRQSAHLMSVSSASVARIVVVNVGLDASTFMVRQALCCHCCHETSLGFTSGLGLGLGVLDFGVTSGCCALEGVIGALEGGSGLSSHLCGCLSLGLTVGHLLSCAG